MKSGAASPTRGALRLIRFFVVSQSGGRRSGGAESICLINVAVCCDGDMHEQIIKAERSGSRNGIASLYREPSRAYPCTLKDVCMPSE